MSWNIGDNRNLFLKLKTKLGLYHVILTLPKSPKITLTIAEMQQLPEIDSKDPTEEISCLKWTIFNGRRKICIDFKTDLDNLNITVFRYRNNVYLKETSMELTLMEYKTLLAKRVYMLSYVDVFNKRCIVMDETTIHN